MESIGDEKTIGYREIRNEVLKSLKIGENVSKQE